MWVRVCLYVLMCVFLLVCITDTVSVCMYGNERLFVQRLLLLDVIDSLSLEMENVDHYHLFGSS